MMITQDDVKYVHAPCPLNPTTLQKLVKCTMEFYKDAFAWMDTQDSAVINVRQVTTETH